MRFVISFLLFLFFVFLVPHALAAESPFAHPNNKMGVHILFPSELEDAAKLVNSNGGDWGYVTIPIQATDKNVDKWQDFFNQCRKLHIIPIVRLATEGDYFNTSVWRKPTPLDVLDFANFLTDLNWPTKNRYIIVFNEVNRGDEWGGQPNASEYADILSYAVTVFKSKNPDFFIISAGLDNAAANSGTAMDEYTYLTAMNNAIPGIFNQIDGLGSHSYPNPAFSSPPWVTTYESIASFKFEKLLVGRYVSKDLPVFISETGWSSKGIADATIASYYQQAFSNTWSDASIVAITPFILKAGAGPFEQFSIEKADGTLSRISDMLKSLPKIKGAPVLVPQVLAAESINRPHETEHFGLEQIKQVKLHVSSDTKALLKWLLHIQ